MSVEHAHPVEPFDPAIPGTPDDGWDRLLRSSPDWVPGPHSLLVVSPHPDDEVLAAGGLMRLHTLAGFDVTVLSVTDGAAAYPDWANLDSVRRRELHDALTVLGRGRIKQVQLGIPDGHVDEHRHELANAITRLSVHQPILVAPYESDGHPDHDATGTVCMDVARRAGLTLIRYPVWTWHHATPDAFAGRRWGRVQLDVATQLAKAHAIECFASQLRPSGRTPIVPDHVLRYFARRYEAFLL